MGTGTSIRLTEGTRDRIKQFGQMGDSYEDVLNRLMDAAKVRDAPGTPGTPDGGTCKTCDEAALRIKALKETVEILEAKVLEEGDDKRVEGIKNEMVNWIDDAKAKYPDIDFVFRELKQDMEKWFK